MFLRDGEEEKEGSKQSTNLDRAHISKIYKFLSTPHSQLDIR